MKIVRILILIVVTCRSVNTAFAQNWILTSAPYNSLTSVASSANGRNLVVVSFGKGIYTSSNSGSTWLEVSNYSSGMWFPAFGGIEFYSVASSSEGSKLVAPSWNGYGIFTSTNSGATWQSTDPVQPERQWYAVASSADGHKLVATIYYGGPVYGSTNSGVSWMQLTNFPNPASQNIRAIASSADGNKLATASSAYLGSGGICLSTNSGLTWVEVTNVPNDNWISIASSADGTKLVAAPLNDSIYISTNGGVTWSPTETPSEAWASLAMSADGTKVIAGCAGVLYSSDDSGNTWVTNNVPSGNWNYVASSADGNVLAAVDSSGSEPGLWTSQTSTAPNLNVAVRNNNLTLSWIVPSINFLLQQNSDLTTADWTDVTNAPVLNPMNLQEEVTLPLTNNNCFYRLATE